MGILLLSLAFLGILAIAGYYLGGRRNKLLRNIGILMVIVGLSLFLLNAARVTPNRALQQKAKRVFLCSRS